ncbi:MAG: class I SAM-dependent methyltransferase [bacterium]
MGYHVAIDLNNENSSHTQIVKKIPKYANVLELGCAHGDMANVLKRELQCRVIGIEKDPNAAADAHQVCDYVFVENLDDPQSLDALQLESFDVISLVDVLEHLDNPLALLKRLKPLLLESDGRLLLSVPNVAHASVRLELLNGSFNYEDSGILDRTHKHFYTSQSIQALLREAGYTIHEIDYTWHELPEDVIEKYLQNVHLTANREALDYFRSNECIAYQFIISASPISETISSLPVTRQLKPMKDSWERWQDTQKRLSETEYELSQIKSTKAWKVASYLRKTVS